MDQQDDQNRKKNNPLSSYAQFSGSAFQMIAIIGLGVYFGVKLDEKYPNKYKLFTITLPLLSIGIALFNLIRQVTRFTNKQKNTNDKKSN
ncbi:AtpZ/AtpI family protein [Flavobacteriaceae bacterium LMO-SS05]